jgi:hypothetical protein
MFSLSTAAFRLTLSCMWSRNSVLQGKDARYASTSASVLEQPDVYQETEQRPVTRRQKMSEPQEPYKGQASVRQAPFSL